MGVEVQPDDITLVEEPLEPDVVKANLVLKNHGPLPITLTSVDASCGCMQLLTQGGVSMEGPMIVPAGGSIPWQVSITTATRIGPQIYNVAFLYNRGSLTEQVTATIKFNVRSGLRADPGEILFRDLVVGESVNKKVDIYDSFPDPGIRIKEVRTSDHQVLATKLRQLSTDASEDSSVNWSMTSFTHTTVPMKRRYVIDVTLTPLRTDTSHGMLQEDIVLVPEDPKRSPLTILIGYTLKQPDFALMPSTLVLSKDDFLLERVHRRVVCALGSGASMDLRVLSVPEGTRVVATPIGGTERRTIEFDIDLDPARLLAGQSREITFTSGSSPEAIIKLPILVIE